MQSPVETERTIKSSNEEYERILIAHDGTEMSDEALKHACYLSKISGAELVIMNVIDVDVIPPSFLLAFIKPDRSEEQAKEEIRTTIEGGVRQMLEQRVRACKSLGVTRASQLIRVGKPSEQIIKAMEDQDVDLVVMASGKITSTVRSIGSVARRVLDNASMPVLIVYKR